MLAVNGCGFTDLQHVDLWWCRREHIESSESLQNTLINLSTRVLPYDNEKNNDILIEIDKDKFNEKDMMIIQKLSEIFDDSGKVGEFNLSNLFINIIKLNILK